MREIQRYREIEREWREIAGDREGDSERQRERKREGGRERQTH